MCILIKKNKGKNRSKKTSNKCFDYRRELKLILFWREMKQAWRQKVSIAMV